MTTYLQHPSRSSELLPALMKAVRCDAEDVKSGPRPTSSPTPVSGRGNPAGSATAAVTEIRAVPAAADDLRSLETVLADRRSERFYDQRPIRIAELTAALRQAVQSDRASFGQGTEDALRPQFVIAANRVDGLPPGLYRFSDDDGTFTFLAPSDRSIVEAMVLQIEYADAPCIIAVLGSLALSLQRWGDHGERLLNTRSSAACYTALLTANALGLAGSVFAGFLPSGLSEHLDIDGFTLGQVFAVSLGHPPLKNPSAAPVLQTPWTPLSTPATTPASPSERNTA
jgi:nitroreductase